MSQPLPIEFVEHLQLTDIGINLKSISYSTLTMESDKFICIRENEEETRQLSIIDLNESKNSVRLQFSVDSAIVDPSGKLIALKAQQTLQILIIKLKSKVKEHEMPEEVVFWTWISLNSLALVTETSVYHWSMEGDAIPLKIFDRDVILDGYQIINYRTDPKQQWLLLVGFLAHQHRAGGNMQLYSIESNASKAIEGYAASFATFKLEENLEPSALFCFADKQLHVIEIGTSPPGSTPFTEKVVDLMFPPEAKGDFPVAMEISAKYGVIYLITIYGYIHVYDIESGTCIFMNRISADTIFVTAPHESSGGIIAVNCAGQVLSVTVDEEQIIPYVANVLQNVDLALQLAHRYNLTVAKELFAKNAIKPLQTPSTPKNILKYQQEALSPYFMSEARSLVRGRNVHLWNEALSDDNPFRCQLIDQIIKTALPETQNPEDISVTVGAFMVAGLTNKFFELLENIVYISVADSNSRNLQNILILAAISVERSRVMNYVNHFYKFDSALIANFAIRNQLYEEAFAIYEKFGANISAFQVLIEHIKNLGRAKRFAERCNEPAVWTQLGKAQLEHDLVSEAAESFNKSDNPSAYYEFLQSKGQRRSKKWWCWSCC